MRWASVHLTSREQFNHNHVINLASYSPLGNFMDEPKLIFLFNIVEIFQIIFKFQKILQLPLSHEPGKFQIVINLSET